MDFILYQYDGPPLREQPRLSEASECTERAEQVRIRNLTTPLTKLASAHNVFKIARAFHSFLNTQMRLQWNCLIPYRRHSEKDISAEPGFVAAVSSQILVCGLICRGRHVSHLARLIICTTYRDCGCGWAVFNPVAELNLMSGWGFRFEFYERRERAAYVRPTVKLKQRLTVVWNTQPITFKFAYFDSQYQL